MQRCPKCGWTGEAEACAQCGTATAQAVEPEPGDRGRGVALVVLLVVLPALALAGYVAWYHATQGVRVNALAPSATPRSAPGSGGRAGPASATPRPPG